MSALAAEQEQGNVAPPEATPPPDVENVERREEPAPEAGLAEAAAPETEGEGGPEPEKPASKYAGKSDEEIESLLAEARRDTEQRTRQSERDKAEAAAHKARFEREATEANATRQGEYLRKVAGIAKHYLDGGKELDQQGIGWLQQVVKEMDQSASLAALFQAHLTYNEQLTKLAKEYEVPEAVQEQYEHAYYRRDYAELGRIRAEQLYEAGLAAGRKAGAKEAASRAQAEKRVAAGQERDATRAGSPSPSAGGRNAATGHQYKTRLELDAAIAADPDILPRGPSSRAFYNELARNLPYQ